MNKNLEAIKKEFENDEKILENAFKLERFFKKYKYILLGVVLGVVAWVTYINVYDHMEEKKALEISAIYDELMSAPDNEILRKSLQEKAPKLYDLFLYAYFVKNNDKNALANLTESQNQIVSDLAKYEMASATKDKQALANIGSDFKNLAKLQEAYLLLQENEIAKMRQILESIPEESSEFEVAQYMSHYGITRIPKEEMRIQEVAQETKPKETK